jgi:hypothetical protein
MNKVYELQSDTLIELSKKIFPTLNYPLTYANDVAFWDLFTLPDQVIQEAKRECSLVSGKCACLFLLPNSHTPIHVDNHDHGKYYRSLNVLVEENNYNHKTFYYDYKGGWDMHERGAIYGWDYNKSDSNINPVFEMQVTKPVIFWNQMLHNTENYEGNRRVMFMWEIHKDITDEDIINWCNNSNIDYKVLF